MSKKRNYNRFCTSLSIRSKDLVIPDEKISIGSEYYLVTDPNLIFLCSQFDPYTRECVVEHSVPILIDNKPLYSDNPIIKEKFTANKELFRHPSMHAVIIATYHFEDRTVVHFRLSTTCKWYTSRRSNELKYARQYGFGPLPAIKGDKDIESILVYGTKDKIKFEDVPFMIITRNENDVVLDFDDIREMSTSKNAEDLFDDEDGEDICIANNTISSILHTDEYDFDDDEDDDDDYDLDEDDDEYDEDDDFEEDCDDEEELFDDDEIHECTTSNLSKKAKKKFNDTIIRGITKALNSIDFSTFSDDELRQIIDDIDSSTAEKLSDMIGSEFDMCKVDVLEAIAGTKAETEHTSEVLETEVVDTVTKVATDTGTTIKETTTTVTETATE